MGDSLVKWSREHIESENGLLLAILFVLAPYLVLANLVIAFSLEVQRILILWVMAIAYFILFRKRQEEERILLLWFTNYLCLWLAAIVAVCVPASRSVHAEGSIWLALAVTLLNVLVLQGKYRARRGGRTAEGETA